MGNACFQNVEWDAEVITHGMGSILQCLAFETSHFWMLVRLSFLLVLLWVYEN